MGESICNGDPFLELYEIIFLLGITNFPVRGDLVRGFITNKVENNISIAVQLAALIYFKLTVNFLPGSVLTKHLVLKSFSFWHSEDNAKWSGRGSKCS